MLQNIIQILRAAYAARWVPGTVIGTGLCAYALFGLRIMDSLDRFLDMPKADEEENDHHDGTAEEKEYGQS